MLSKKIQSSINYGDKKVFVRRAESKSPSLPCCKKLNDNDDIKQSNNNFIAKNNNHESRIDAFLREKKIIDPKKLLVNSLVARNNRVMELRNFIKRKKEKNEINSKINQNEESSKSFIKKASI